MNKEYLLNESFRKIILRIIDNPFGYTKISDLSDLIPFEVPNKEEIFIEDGRCFVRHSDVFVTYFYVENGILSNYELIKRIVNKYNITLNGPDERAKQQFVDEVKSLVEKLK